ncbi:hypothetical protein STVA_37480 [Allostella vacuolata]|nr:hypothetical protein STVA_37480 [Stella vacuolata]
MRAFLIAGFCWALLGAAPAGAAVGSAMPLAGPTALQAEPVAKAAKAARLGACGGDYVKSKSKRKRKAYCGRRKPAAEPS